MSAPTLQKLVEEAVELLGATRVPRSQCPPGVTLWRIEGYGGSWQTSGLVNEAFNRIGKTL